GVRGPTRAIFGLARSFINMGQDGVLYKRFLLHDRYNPTSVVDLIRLSIFKLAGFYFLLLAVLCGVLGSETNRRVLLFSLLGAMPVVLFGLFWYGGDVERYLPLYPFFFLALACAFEGREKWVKAAALVFLVTATVSNLSAMSVLRLRNQ